MDLVLTSRRPFPGRPTVRVGTLLLVVSALWITALVALPGSATAAPDTGDTVGLVNPGTGEWRLRNQAGVVTTFYYGNPGDFPLMGDWDCNGTDTPGMYRQTDGFVYVRNSNSVGIADRQFFLGNPGDVPLAGDFNGDGCDTVSIYRPSEQRFYIANKLAANNAGIVADWSFLFGNPGDKPVTGDWDADGITEIGLHRESTGFFYWRNTLDTGIASNEIFFGDPGDRFVAGDWGIVDGIDTPAVFRPTGATFFFRHTLTQGRADSEFFFGRSSWLPVAGRFTADGGVTTTTTSTTTTSTTTTTTSTTTTSTTTTSTTTTTMPGVLPQPADLGAVAAGGKAQVTIDNATHHGLTFQFQGPESPTVAMDACPTCIDWWFPPTFCPSAATEKVLLLAPGEYTVTARADDPSIRSFVGTWTLEANRGYYTCFYILKSFL